MSGNAACFSLSRLSKDRGHGSGLTGLLVLIGGFFVAVPLAQAQTADVNCNKILRPFEKDPNTGQDCVDYFKNGNTCTPQSEVVFHRPCDDYVAPGINKAATCSPFLAPDRDGDLVGDSCDNCPDVYNPNQRDADYLLCPDGQTHDPNVNPCPDGFGDVCDNCPDVYNPDQKDSYGYGIGDACNFCIPGVKAKLPNGYTDPRQTDTDYLGCPPDGHSQTPAMPCADGIPDKCDNCPTVYNPDQTSTVTMGIGDACNLCIPGVRKMYPNLVDPRQKDTDGDGIPDACDNCPFVYNPDQADTDSEGCPNPADDGQLCPDGVGNACDNCPTIYNPDQKSSSNDGIGDACQPGVQGGPSCALVQDRGGNLPESLANIFAFLALIGAALYFSVRPSRRKAV